MPKIDSNRITMHRSNFRLSDELYAYTVIAVGDVHAANDETEKYFGRVMFESSYTGGYWDVCVASPSYRLLLEFLGDVFKELPPEKAEVIESAEEPETVPLDESLEGIQTIVSEIDEEDTDIEEDEVSEDDPEEAFQGLPTDGGPVRKKKLLKPVTAQKVASGVTVEDFDEDAEA